MTRKNWTGIFTAAAVAVMLVLFVAPVSCHAAVTFKDTKGHWAEQSIEKAASLGIIKGYSDGRFLPDANVTRAEFVSMLNRALGNTATADSGFTDVKSTEWYYYDVQKSVTAGYVNGFSDKTFKPDKTITRQEAAVMLSKLVPTYGYGAGLGKFQDARNVADWAQEAMSRMNGKGYISGYTDGKIHPLDSLTRAQAAKIISEIVQKESIDSSDPVVKKDGTKLSGTIFTNNVTIHKDLGDGEVSLTNCVILGKLIVQGGGEESVTISNSRIVSALINRADGRVRLVAKGETTVLDSTGSRDFLLETSGLSGGEYGAGFKSVGVGASASGFFKGSFPYVFIDGTGANVQLQSGAIDTLEVKSAGRKSYILIDGKASVGTANVYGESYFQGTGTISDMQVYAKGVTYETKPKKWSIQSGGETPAQSDPELSISFEPASGKTNVYLDTTIKLTFSQAMREADGSTIVNSEIPKIVTIRKGSATGTAIDYTGSINSAKTVMTLSPAAPLAENTRYYIAVKAGTMLDANGDKNKAETSYFNTGKSTEKLVVTYSPANGETGVAADRKSFTIQFSEALTKYNGGTISTSDSYLENSVIQFKKASTAVNASSYSVSINPARTKITVTLEDGYDLSLNTNYTIGIKAQTLKTASGEAVPASNATWTTAGLPVLSSTAVVPYEKAVDLKATPSVSGRLYAVLLPSDAAAPTAARIREGKDATGALAIASANAAAATGKAMTVQLAGEDIQRDTPYKVHAVLYDGSDNVSAVTSIAVTTEPLKLKSLTIIPDTSATSVLTGFRPEKLDYGTITVPDGTKEVSVTAEANAAVFVGSLTINGDTEIVDKKISLAGGTADISIVIQETGKRSVTYSVKIKVAASAALKTLTVNGAAYVPGTSPDIAIGPDQRQVELVVVPEDAAAVIRIDGTVIGAGVPVLLSIGAETSEIKLDITPADGGTAKRYTIRLDRTPVPEP